MVDYAKLAVKAKGIQDADRLAVESHKKLRADPCYFFDKVKAHIIEEMNMANVELRKRGADIIGRNFLPGFDDEIFLTYGTDSLCRVGLGIREGECRITAVISGPPNGYELSRKEFFCSQDANCLEVLLSGRNGRPKIVTAPQEVAVDIISGILRGKFA